MSEQHSRPGLTALLVVVMLAAVTFAPAFAHLAEMPNKLSLDGATWYRAQFIYRGWGAVLGPLARDAARVDLVAPPRLG